VTGYRGLRLGGRGLADERAQVADRRIKRRVEPGPERKILALPALWHVKQAERCARRQGTDRCDLACGTVKARGDRFGDRDAPCQIWQASFHHIGGVVLRAYGG